MNTKKIFTTLLLSLLVVILFSIFTGCNAIKTDLLLPQLMVLRKALATVGLATEPNAGAGNPNTPTTPTAPVTPNTPVVTIDAPTFSPAAGTYTSTQTVTISTTTTGAILCYTTDGSTPSCDSTPTCASGTSYSSPVSIATTTTLKALACKAGNQYSAVGTGIYTIGNTSCSISPDNISGLKLWLNADSLSQSDGSTVNSWIDSSGNSNTVVAGNAPLFYNNIINGKPVVRFNGSSNRLFKVPASGLGTNYSSFFVIRRNVISTQEMILQLSPAGCTNGLSFYFLNTNALRTDKCGDGASALNTSVFFNNTQPSYFSVHYNGSSVNTFFGGNADTNLNYVMAISPTNIYLGSDSASANYFNGDIAEIIVYNVALNSSDRICIDNYIGQKYGLSIAIADTTAPTIFSTTPIDNATSIATNATISVTFSESMNAATMTTNTNTTCSGSLQVSADNFTTCIPMTSSTPTSSASDSVFTVTPASLLTLNTTYKVRVTTGVTDYSGNQLLSAYTTTTGFTTNSPPSALTYSGSPYTFTQNVAITTITPTVTGTVTNCTSVPPMPTGMILNNTTCAISGTPTVTQGATSYTITASNTGGNTTASIDITINSGPPALLKYTGSPFAYKQNAAITTTTPTVIGTVTSCNASPSLPAGLSIDNTTCAISGTPTTLQGFISYTITATNGFGSTTASIIITITLTDQVCYAWGCFEDLMNGTIQFVGIAGTFGGNGYPAQTLTFMKCSQGQTWNSGTNGCDGVAGGYQFCSSSGDNNCNGGLTSNELGVGGFIGGSTSTAFNECDSLVFAANSNWRVPTRNELKTLINCNNKFMPDEVSNISCGIGNFTSPTVNSFFPNTVANNYWSSTTYAPLLGKAWIIGFATGLDVSNLKPTNLNLRCVSP